MCLRTIAFWEKRRIVIIALAVTFLVSVGIQVLLLLIHVMDSGS